MKIVTITEVPDDLAKAWLQHLRDFDVTHPGCHFEVLADALDLSLAQCVELLRVSPELPIKEVFKR